MSNKNRNKPHHDKKPDTSKSTAVASSVVIKGVQPAVSPLQPFPARGEGARTSSLFLAGEAPELREGTLQQRRAHFALQRIRQLAENWKEDTKKQKEFNSYASAMPFMIHVNGLGQTAAFYRRKGIEHVYYQLYQLLGEWLSQPGQPFSGKNDLLIGITESDMETYLVAQIESMLFLDWVKKLSSAFLARDEESTS